MEQGTVFENKQGRTFVVESRSDQSTNKHTFYNIRFQESGYTASVRSDIIRAGYVRDKLEKRLCGVAAIGNINTRKHWHEYRIWENIISRCYDPADKSYCYYGAKGVYVCERWLTFQYFYEDMKTLPGFNALEFEEYHLRLDKDILSKGGKCYSPQTCCWVDDLQNQKQRTAEYNMRHQKYAVFPDGHIELLLNVSDFCKRHQLHRANVYACLRGEYQSTKGFRFYWGS